VLSPNAQQVVAEWNNERMVNGPTGDWVCAMTTTEEWVFQASRVRPTLRSGFSWVQKNNFTDSSLATSNKVLN